MRQRNLFVPVILILMLLTGIIIPVLPTRAQTQTTPGSLIEIIWPDTAALPAQFGVYLGHGLILTNWHPWTLDGHIYADKKRTLAASWQVTHYDDDGVSDPGEWLLDRIGRIAGAGVTIPGDTANDPLPVERLIYADRATDIALFTVDAATIEARGAIPAQLSAYLPESNLLSAEAPVWIATASDQGAAAVAGTLTTSNPELLPASEDRRLDGPWQVWSLRLTAPEQIPDGSPIFAAENSDLIGLVWRAEEGITPGAHWVTPTAIWLHDLYAANEAIQNADLAAVLQNVTLTPVEGDLTLHDPLTPELGNAGIDVQHVALDLAFDLDTHTITGSAALDIRATAHGLQTFGLDATGLDIVRVTVDGVETSFTTKTNKLRLELANPVAFGTVFHAEIAYRAAPEPFRSPYMPGFDIGMFWGDAENPTVSTLDQPDGAQTWFPINDHPSDRATYEFRLRVPEPLTALANGTLTETRTHEDGSRTFVWRMDQPMASYLTVIAVADYIAVEDAAADGTPITHYVYADQAEIGRDLFSYTDDALTMLAAWFGPYPYAHYGHVVAPVEGMALETQTLTTMPDLVLDWSELEIYELMVHELAHQWYGNTVTPGVWSDIWLNEGFARYSQWLARDERFGAEAALAARSSSE
ncbi:MAG: M1 family metallopeptidase, partial [Anaerolineae bacterium]|nr:M1 family metallopeptidase [Anaerolineae bacterium]